MPQGWMSGSCGKRGEGGKSVGRVNLPRMLFLFFSIVFCMGVLLPRVVPWSAGDLICCNRLAEGRQLDLPIVSVALATPLG